MEFSHEPVLFDECMEQLAIRPEGVYVDGTLGGGGHSAGILARLGDKGRLIGIDRDADAIAAASARLGGDARFMALRGNFHDAAELLAGVGVQRISGMLLDLGVSSYQLDEGARGFSYHADAPLDMRMDRSQSLTARDVVNGYSREELTRVLRDWGEENWAAQIARVICDRRTKAPIETTAQLVDVIDAAIPAKVRRRDGSHPARRTFQALRIEVNDELGPLRAALESAARLLEPGGRLCVIAFHSLEDRIVKQTFRKLQNPCICPPSFPVCVCGRKSLGRQLTGKPITAGPAELERNPRSRSATLRVFERGED
ncbi:MAG TPA: 16S rRNA (cytosine(1402)-N(4))-methyltransferase RsmH [Candidatus Fimadaptatus faecigallinarum]|uniref:Ribosomal RNA small subunit methyltransferase H n=1 Tax=Candidatus Fimadaptatus faecigallinarum TaxID=2840814 RepID=A0A9D1S4R3_9FIRM|nr:16S rRNA (cytosine(1402)-N(4))-methyltransferase RsmH [Candidatus Fimadaptatus faecigallinarum]